MTTARTKPTTLDDIDKELAGKLARLKLALDARQLPVDEYTDATIALDRWARTAKRALLEKIQPSAKTSVTTVSVLKSAAKAAPAVSQQQKPTR